MALLIRCLLCNFGQWPTGGDDHLNALIRQGDSLSPYSFVLLFFSFFLSNSVKRSKLPPTPCREGGDHLPTETYVGYTRVFLQLPGVWESDKK
jgi:hypothetical protein